MRPFSREGKGVRVRLGPDEVDALRMVPELLATVGEVPGDPAAARLDVSVYPDDEAAADEFRRLMAAEMNQGRTADRSAFEEALDAVGDGDAVLSLAEAEAWLVVLGEARLALAARLGIEEEGWGSDAATATDPPMAMLQYLSWLQGSLTEVLLDTL